MILAESKKYFIFYLLKYVDLCVIMISNNWGVRYEFSFSFCKISNTVT